MVFLTHDTRCTAGIVLQKQTPALGDMSVQTLISGTGQTNHIGRSESREH